VSLHVGIQQNLWEGFWPTWTDPVIASCKMYINLSACLKILISCQLLVELCRIEFQATL
jgi:hypothetical protein